jgi:Uri superfamily endonuclease
VSAAATSYQLHIRLRQSLRLRIGALGELQFPAGEYVYTGSARRNLAARIARHRRRDKPLRWHIDYLLADPATTIEQVATGTRPECGWNQATAGRVLHPGFGASDCRAGCGAHLKWLGATAPAGQ